MSSQNVERAIEAVEPGHDRLSWHKAQEQITIRVDEPALEYFKDLANEVGIPYQTLINLYLRDCAVSGKRPSLSWRAAG